MTKTCVADGRHCAVVDDVGGELRRKSAFKPVPIKAVPKHLLKNSLVVARE